MHATIRRTRFVSVEIVITNRSFILAVSFRHFPRAIHHQSKDWWCMAFIFVKRRVIRKDSCECDPKLTILVAREDLQQVRPQA